MQAYRDEGQYLAAASACRCAIRLGDADACSWEELGDLYEAQGRLAAAVEAYQQAVRAIGEAQANDDAPISDLGVTWMKLGNVYEAHGQRSEAVAAYDQAIAPLVAVMGEGDALHRDEWASLGRMYDRQGKHQEAAKAFEKAVAQYREVLRSTPMLATRRTTGVCWDKSIGIRGSTPRPLPRIGRHLPRIPTGQTAGPAWGSRTGSRRQHKDAFVAFCEAVRVAPHGVHAQRGLREAYGRHGIPADGIAAFREYCRSSCHRCLRVALFGGRV